MLYTRQPTTQAMANVPIMPHPFVWHYNMACMEPNCSIKLVFTHGNLFKRAVSRPHRAGLPILPSSLADRCSKMGRAVGEGLRSYYKGKIEELELLIKDKGHNLRRLEAQRNELNAHGANSESIARQPGHCMADLASRSEAQTSHALHAYPVRSAHAQGGAQPAAGARIVRGRGH